MSQIARAYEAYRRALDNEHSSFYRTLYKDEAPVDPSFPATEKEWRQIPFLTREDLTRTPFSARLFVPLEDVRTIRCSSGTSGKGVLCVPHAIAGGEYAHERVSAFAGCRVVMFQYHFYAPKSRVRSDGRTQRVICADRMRLAESARIAAAFGVDSITGQASELIRFAEHLKAHMDLNSIKHIRTSGERSSALQMETLQTLYPSAHRSTQYNASEAEGWIGAADYPHPIEIFSRFYVEIIDEHQQPIPEGAEGEIVLTSLEPGTALPLIRYRTGDRARLIKKEGDTVLLEILGRSGDRIRIPGGEIYAAELERVVRIVCPEMLDFECRVTEVRHKAALLVQLEVTIITSGAFPTDSHIAERIGQLLRVNAHRTYADGIAKGLYAPIICRTTAAPPTVGGRKRQQLTDARL